MKYLLAIDQGTTGTTAMLIDQHLNEVGKINVTFQQYYPQPGWVEHNPDMIWQSIRGAVKQVLREKQINPKEIAAIGITNQRETVSVWNRKSGKFYHPFIVWQDRRTAEWCKKHKSDEAMITQKTGLLLDPYFSGTKIAWILKNKPEAKKAAKAGDAVMGTIDTYLLYRLTDRTVTMTDTSNASRTLLMNINTGQWDDKLLNYFKIPKSILPEIGSSAEIYGATKGLDFLPDGIPISGIAGDQQAALFGQACFTPGGSKATYGTGSFILMNTGAEPLFSKNRLLTTVAWKIGNQITYALEGSAFIAGALVQWLRDELKFFSSSQEIETLAETVEDSGHITIIPSFTGLGAPYWRPDLSGMIYGLSRNSNRGHIARAALEAIALQNRELLLAMVKDSGQTIPYLKVDGGASLNNILMQFQADCLDVSISRPNIFETTALGAAMLAGLGCGLFTDLSDLEQRWHSAKTYAPYPTDQTQKVIQRWEKTMKMILA